VSFPTILLLPGRLTWHGLSSLHSKYHDFNQKLGCTGAGLPYDEIEPGSNIYNLIGAFSL